jgi:hypothetical protein
MRAYITILGRSIWAVINSLYAVMKHEDIRPDVVYIITENIFKEKLESTVEGVKIVLDEFGIEPRIETKIVAEGKFVLAGNAIKNLIKDLKDRDYSIDVDITPGRKSLVAGMMLVLNKEQVDHIFYLDIKTIVDVSYPYEMIPKQIQSLKDFMKEGKEMPASD